MKRNIIRSVFNTYLAASVDEEDLRRDFSVLHNQPTTTWYTESCYLPLLDLCVLTEER